VQKCWPSASNKAPRSWLVSSELTEGEWRKPVSETDHRTIGVIVYPVAAVYPIEVDLAQAIAAGNAITSHGML